MSKIVFRNSTSFSSVTAVYLDRDDERVEERLSACENGMDYMLETDFADCLVFSDEKYNKTASVYPGKLSLGVEYKRNEKLGRNLTYLFSLEGEKSGRVENFVLRDEVNLSHREDKSKKISVYLPNSYDGVTEHDILYFFDAQNLFCAAGEYTDCGDPYGSWQIDVVINELHRQYGKNIIVVGIDNADMYRSQELFMNPSDFGKLSPLATEIPEDDFSIGYLDGLSNFMVSTLHNFIKEKYCVKEDNIGIGGSSMGGIASFYCGLRDMGFYKYVLSYSPAFALYEKEAFDNWFSKLKFAENNHILPRIHIYCGMGDQLETKLLDAALEMKPLMIDHGYDIGKIAVNMDITKDHNEESWRLVLPRSFSFLLDL